MWLYSVSQEEQPLMYYLLCLLHYTFGDFQGLLRCRSSGLCPERVASTELSHVYFLFPPLPPASPKDGAQVEPGASANARDVSAGVCVCLESESAKAPPHHPLVATKGRKILNKYCIWSGRLSRILITIFMHFFKS